MFFYENAFVEKNIYSMVLYFFYRITRVMRCHQLSNRNSLYVMVSSIKHFNVIRFTPKLIKKFKESSVEICTYIYNTNIFYLIPIYKKWNASV